MEAGEIHRLVQDAFNAGDESGDIALLSNDWHFVADHPYGGADVADAVQE